MKTAAETSDFERFYQHDLEFHRTIWRLSQNRYLGSCLETLVVPLLRSFSSARAWITRSICWAALNGIINFSTPSGADKGSKIA